MNNNIYYNRGNKRVRQVLDAISRYDFEDEFDKAIANLTAEYELCKKQYLEEEIEILITAYPYEYSDGRKKKKVKFDKLFLEWQDSYDNDKELVIIGERNFDASELAALEKESLKQQECEKEHLRKLKKKYPEV